MKNEINAEEGRETHGSGKLLQEQRMWREKESMKVIDAKKKDKEGEPAKKGIAEGAEAPPANGASNKKE